MSDGRHRQGKPTNESSAGLRRPSAHDHLDDMRAARRAERAPDAVRERLLERARELSGSVHWRAGGPSRGVEGQQASSLPLDLHPALHAPLGLLEDLRSDRRPADGVLGELGAWRHPLLARVAGASLMLGLVVLVIADVRRPSGLAQRGSSAEDLSAEGLAAASSTPASPANAEESAEPVPLEAGLSASAMASALRSPEPTPAAAEATQSDRQSGSHALPPGPVRRDASAALASAAEHDRPQPVPARAPRTSRERARAPLATSPLFVGPARGSSDEHGEPHSELSSLTQQLAALSRRAQRAASPAAGLPDHVPGPADPTAPWLSPRAASSALRALARPELDGTRSHPKGTHILARGNVRAEPGRNFITNGDFSRGDQMWSVRSWQGLGDTSVAAYYSVRAGALCTSLERNEQVLGGWPWDDRRSGPSSFDLERGKRYRLSLRAWSSGPELVQLVVKVGSQKPPYAPALVAQVPLAAEPGLFDIDFVAERHETAAGFVFVATGPAERPLSEFCIDDVSVRPLHAEP